MLPNGNKQPGGLGQALALFGLLIAISVGVLLFSPSNNPAVNPSTPADQATSVPAVMGEATPSDDHGDHQHGEDADKSNDDHGDHQHGETFVRFVNLEDGQTVTSPFVVEMVVSDNLEVVPAGGEVHDHSGHLHILVNTDFVQEGEMIEDDHQHLHFSEGEISTELTLEAGEYVLRLQFANSDHIAYAGEAYTDEVTITVSN